MKPTISRRPVPGRSRCGARSRIEVTRTAARVPLATDRRSTLRARQFGLRACIGVEERGTPWARDRQTATPTAIPDHSALWRRLRKRGRGARWTVSVQMVTNRPPPTNPPATAPRAHPAPAPTCRLGPERYGCVPRCALQSAEFRPTRGRLPRKKHENRYRRRPLARRLLVGTIAKARRSKVSMGLFARRRLCGSACTRVAPGET